MARRHGRQQAADAFAEAAHVTALWARHGFYRDRRTPLIDAFLDRPLLTGRLPAGDPVTPIVTYPETVALARVLATPQWRHPTTRATKRELRQFKCEIDRLVGIRYHPEDSPYDPLHHWFQLRHELAATVLPPASTASSKASTGR